MSRTNPRIEDVVEKYLSFQGKCYRHCDQSTSLRKISEVPTGVVGYYSCPSNYVSRFIYYDSKPNQQWFITFIKSKVPSEVVRETDVRNTSRHAWELGAESGDEQFFPIEEVYWTPPRSLINEGKGVFECSNCHRFFVQEISSKTSIGPECSSK